MSTWTIDPVHSSVEFSLDYMGFSMYRTGFRSLEGSLEFDPARPTSASVNASIPVASIDVTNEDKVVDPAVPQDLCAVLPTDEADPCSHLCDEDGISSFIPEHTCVLFVCHLTDGTTYHAGGCVP